MSYAVIDGGLAITIITIKLVALNDLCLINPLLQG